MMKNKMNRDYRELKREFVSMPIQYRPVPFYHMDGKFAEGGELTPEVAKNIALYKKSGYGGITPLPVSAKEGHAATSPTFGTEEYYDSYKALLDKAKEQGMSVIFYDDLDFPSGRAGGELARVFPESTALELKRFEYECMEGSTIRRELHGEDGARLQSIVAVEVDERSVIDLREFVKDGVLEWTVPDGNWNVEEYICLPTGNGFVNYMSYDACLDYISLTYKRFADRYADYVGDVVEMTFYDDLQYQAPNRRMWDYGFNAFFEEKYGFDPAPYYPALWEYIGEDTAHYKALFMDCRAHMFADGFFKAVGDFTRRNGLKSVGHVAEPKDAAGSWMWGDGFLWRRHGGAVGLDLVHAYMYGLNGLKIASSAAYNYDIDTVACEIWGNYADLDERILYCEAMNAFARGVNYMIPHTLWLSGEARIPHEVSHRSEKFRESLPALNDYMTRCQVMLRGGRHVADIAMLYPIYSVHSQMSLYESEASGFEFPSTPENADYMTLINSIMNYSGHDLTVIHPEIFGDGVTAEDGVLYLNNASNSEEYKLLVLPGMSMISIDDMRVIRKFWEGGGKIIATVELPSRAFEFAPDKSIDAEVREMVEEVFGSEAVDTNLVTNFYENHNENGGAAYFLPSDKTGLDGTYHVESRAIAELIESLDLAWDVEIEDMPRLDDMGALSLNLPSYRGSGIASAMKKSGIFGYIHKHHDDCDAYFLSNSSQTDYDGRILLRGELSPELWNPHNGKIRKLDFERVKKHGVTYTAIDLKLASAESCFIVSGGERDLFGFLRDIID